MSDDGLLITGGGGESPFKEPWEIELEAEVKDDHYPPPDPCISVGTYNYAGRPEPIILGSYGDMSCIVGESKSMKTRLKSVMVACYLGNVKQRFPDWNAHNTIGKYVIELDTEQSEFYVGRMRKNTRDMGYAHDNDRYKTYRLRKYDPVERYNFLEYICLKSPLRDKIGLVIVDGAADLIHDTNDIVQSQKLVNLFMRITDETNCHLTTVLHRTKSSQKPTGHIGSSILKKCETVMILNREDKTVTAKAAYTRGYPINEFKFTLDSEHLPIMEDLEDPFDDD